MKTDGSRIASLALRIRAGEARPALANQCRALTRRVLERMADRLDRGDRVVLIRKLEMRWRLPEEAMEAENAIVRLAADLTSALEPAWATHIETPDPDANLVVFPDAASWWCDALEARAAGHPAWYHQSILDPEPLVVLAEPASKVLALSMLRRLGRRAPEVLLGSPPDALRVWARALQVENHGVFTNGVLANVAPRRTHRLQNVDPGLVALLQQAHAASGPDPSAALIGLGALALHLTRAPSSTPLEAEALAFAEALASLASEDPAKVSPASTKPGRVIAGEPEPLHEITSHAGLFYLAALLVELGIGEHLWAACLPEGQLLGWAAAGLVGDDPVVRWFGGPDVSMPSVTEEQAEEVIAKGCLALARALSNRRDDVAVPSLGLVLRGRELVATLPGSLFPVWSAPCAEASRLGEVTAVLLECWPGRLAAPPALAGLPGLKGRVRVQSERAPRVLFRPDGPDPVARLAAVAIGTAAALFEWRVGEERQDSVAAFVERYLRVGGRLEETGDTRIVHLRATDVSFPVRRAGLDRDPGYLPWLERSVVLRFEGDEPAGDELPIVPDEDFG